MPSTNNRALLLDLTAYLAENNIRRGVLAVSTNAQATDAAFQEVSRNIPVSGSWTYTGLPDNRQTVVRVTKPVRATITKASATFVFFINSLWVHSDTFTSILFENLSTEESTNLTLIQV